MIARLGSAIERWRRERALRYLTTRQALVARLRTRRLPIEVLTLDDLRAQRPSDTVFILGSGPSILDLGQDAWAEVRRHASFGINFSILLDHVPTYYIRNDGKSPWLREHLRRVLAPRRRALAPTVWFVSERLVRRRLHPLYAPDMYPESPRICLFRHPPRIVLERDRPFTAADFARAIPYRGTLGVVLYFVVRLGFTRIVLLGVDLHTSRHFFDDWAEMAVYMQESRREWAEVGRVLDGQPYDSMLPKGNQYRRADEYLYALNELHLAQLGASLYVASPDSILHRRLPVYPWPASGTTTAAGTGGRGSGNGC